MKECEVQNEKETAMSWREGGGVWERKSQIITFHSKYEWKANFSIAKAPTNTPNHFEWVKEIERQTELLPKQTDTKNVRSKRGKGEREWTEKKTN